MRNLSLLSALALLTLIPAARAENGCGPKQVCTYKGALKAGQNCPASFCQDSAYLNGVTAAANGGVLRIKKEQSPEKPKVAKEESSSVKETTEENATKPWVDPPSKAAEWKDPPKRAAKNASGSIPAFATIDLNVQRCRNLKVAYADQSADCRLALDLDGLGLQSGTNGADKFCRNIAGGDEAALIRCLEKPSLDELSVNSMLKKFQRGRVGSLENICREKHGDDYQALLRCVGEQTVVAGGTHGLKRSAPGLGHSTDDSPTVTPVQSESAR